LKKWCLLAALALGALWFAAPLPALAQEAKKDDPIAKLETAVGEAKIQADSAWMLTSTALVLFMVPGLALFYGGMVRRKNVLATMMQSMVCLAVVGVYWMAIGYALAFGDPTSLRIGNGSLIGWSPGLVFLRDVKPDTILPNTNIPVYLHMLFQGMFAIITPALISGAIAERIRFRTYLVFVLLWVTFVYCPLAHCVWAMNWDWANTLAGNVSSDAGKNMVGWLGEMGALDFAGGTVVHIAAGLSSLAAILVLRRRLGYPEVSFHPNSMVLTLTGAGLLWFGWFGFNGGSAVASGTLATSAFAATQAAAAAAGLSWMLVEWAHRGKPTGLGLASGIVAGLVAVTPASGYILPWHGLVIGLLAGGICYGAVLLKSVLKYDDSLDAFGVHGVGGFLGAVLTGVFCVKTVNAAGNDGLLNGNPGQVWTQLYAAVASVVVAFVFSLVLVKLVDALLGFVTDDASEVEGLDHTEHGESGFDFGLAMESAGVAPHAEPRAAMVPPLGKGRFQVVLDGADNANLIKTWSDMCQPGFGCPPEFKAVYPYVTTVKGNRFQFRGGDQDRMRDNMQKLFEKRLPGAVKARVEA
jgi:ammonium transporter